MPQEGGWSLRVGTRADTVLSPQALPSFQIPVSPHIYTSISWAAAPSTASSFTPVSVTVSEPSHTSGPGTQPRTLPHIPSAGGPSPHTGQQHPYFVKINPWPGTLQRVPAPLRKWKGGACREVISSCKFIARKITRRGQGPCPFRPEYLCAR